jgi:hypothetical protein
MLLIAALLSMIFAKPTAELGLLVRQQNLS